MLQRTCTLIALPSTTRASCFLPGSWVDLLIPKHCASGPIIPWQCHQFPESCFSPFHPRLPGASAGKGGDCRCFWRVVAWLAGAQPALCPCGCEARVLVCTDCTGESPTLCPRLVLGMCHPLPRSKVNPDALSLCSESWTVSVTGRLSGHLASSLLPGG